jgi:hypothetical protein
MSNFWTLILASVLEQSPQVSLNRFLHYIVDLVRVFNSYANSANDSGTIRLQTTDLQSRGCYTALRFWNPRIRQSVPAGVPQANFVLKKNLQGA